MSRPSLPQYTGNLTVEQITAGMNAAGRNAHRLAQDARTLLDAGRFPSAASLAALSIEESGKLTILRSIALAQDDAELRQHWKEYRSHTKKNVAWLLPQLVRQGARRLDDFHGLFDPSSDHPHLLDQLKQLGFYTDCLGMAHWSEPDVVIDRELADSLVRTAELMAKGREVTSREIELWIKHLGPVIHGPADWAKTALANWYAEMQREGLVEEGPNEMEQFIRTGLPSPADSDESDSERLTWP